MKIAIATDNFERVTGHAGQARQWLLFEAGAAPAQVTLDAEQVFHHFKDDAPHPLDGVELIVAKSAGDGFRRHMQKRGAAVVLTGEENPHTAFNRLLAGDVLPDPNWDPTLLLCKVRDLFSRH